MSDNKNLLKGATGEWELVIGLEIHAQVNSESKLFSGAKVGFGADPNQQVSLVDAAMPGMLPVINKECVAQAIRTGLGINAKINLVSVFDRKNYFYADLPQGYQISQFQHPIVGEGVIDIDMPDGEIRKVGIERIHLEQDAGKSIHDQLPEHSLIDLNRAGVGLMEIVTRPDIRSSAEAGEFMKKLRGILRYIGSCDGDMEKGNLRCDANVSVRKPGAEFGTRNEIKNLNSIRNIMLAIDFEAQRQIELIESGGVVQQATRLFDPDNCTTRVMRTKENAHDYRYFPDPDLYPLVLEQTWVDELKSALPELPDAKKKKYMEQFGLSAYDASVLVSEREIAEYFEEVADGNDPKQAANWITAELFGRLNKAGKSIEDCPVSAVNMRQLLARMKDNTISGKIAKDVLDAMFETGQTPDEIIEKQGMRQVTDTSAIEAAIDQVIAANPGQLAGYRSGKNKLFGFFVGQVMKATGGKANPAMLNDLLKEKLK